MQISNSTSILTASETALESQSFAIQLHGNLTEKRSTNWIDPVITKNKIIYRHY